MAVVGKCAGAYVELNGNELAETVDAVVKSPSFVRSRG